MNSNLKMPFCYSSRKKRILFPSKEDANNYIMQQSAVNAGEGTTLHAVYCPLCAGWHVTDSPVVDDSQSLPVDGNDNILFCLEQLVNELKNGFDRSLWYLWLPRIEESKTWVAQLEDDESVSALLVEAKRQLIHFETMAKTEQHKEKTKMGRLHKGLHRAEAAVHELVSKFDMFGCAGVASQMKGLLMQPWFNVLTPDEQDSYLTLYDNLTDDALIRKLAEMAVLAKTIRVGIGYVPTDQLISLEKNLNSKIAGVEQKKVHPLLLSSIRKELANIQKQIKLRGEDFLDPKTGVDKVILTLRKQYEHTGRKLNEAETVLQSGDTAGALYLLQSVDEYVRNIPLTREKADILYRIATLTRQCI